MGRFFSAVLRGLVKLLQLIALVAVGFGTPLIVALLLINSNGDVVSQQTAAAAVTGGAFVLLLLLCAGLVMFLIPLARLLPRFLISIKAAPESHVVSLAVAVLFFPTAFASLFVAPIYF